MGSLKRFYRNVLRGNTSFHREYDRISKLELETHLAAATYGNFTLSDAVRPSFDLLITPAQGYRRELYADKKSQGTIPVLVASVSVEELFETFIDLLTPLGDTVDVVLETSHRYRVGKHDDLYRERIDLPVLKSYLYEYEDAILNDGCTGIAVLNPTIPAEVQFDEHKLLAVYARQTEPFEVIFQQHRVHRNDSLKFLTEAEHVHTTHNGYYRQFQQLQTTLGLE